MTKVSDMLFHLGNMPVLNGIPFTRDSQVYLVDPSRGTTGGDGSIDNPIVGIEEAEDKCVANRHDTVLYLAGSSGDTLAAQLTWDKNYTHLIGLTAPTNIAQRARIFYAAALTTTPMLNITASGCIFANIYIFHGVASTASLVCTQVTGGRNYFRNVHFAGIGHATGQGDVAGARSLLLAGAEECLFEGCSIGLDTIARSAANAEIEFTTQARRITFKDCMIYSYADAATHLMVKAASNGNIDRWIRFKDCTFLNIPPSFISGALALTSALNIASGVGGAFIFEDCKFIGCTDIAATGSAARVRMLGHSSDDYSDYSAGIGLAIQPT
jgi:hypothetical protein